jgi:hypothetical protein
MVSITIPLHYTTQENNQRFLVNFSALSPKLFLDFFEHVAFFITSGLPQICKIRNARILSGAFSRNTLIPCSEKTCPCKSLSLLVLGYLRRKFQTHWYLNMQETFQDYFCIYLTILHSKRFMNSFQSSEYSLQTDSKVCRHFLFYRFDINPELI